MGGQACGLVFSVGSEKEEGWEHGEFTFTGTCGGFCEERGFGSTGLSAEEETTQAGVTCNQTSLPLSQVFSVASSTSHSSGGLGSLFSIATPSPHTLYPGVCGSSREGLGFSPQQQQHPPQYLHWEE